MRSTHPLRGLASAAALGGLLWLPGAQAGSFSASAFADVSLLNPTSGVIVNWFNDVIFDDGLASNPPTSFFDNDALLEDPANEMLGTTLTSIGDAFAPGYGTAAVSAALLTEGAIDIENTTGSDVDLEFSYLYGIFASVMAQASGASTANAFARVELFWDLDSILDEIVYAALGALEDDGLDGSGTFSVNVAAGESATIWMFVDAGGDASYVPIPATLALFGLGLAVTGLLRRRA